ncbi:hypothetical protein FH972_018427 [Carpinus fangiana]|uniref:K-box domain-containing protein n=1 Tax=Carpinus fangiana TaxID=176857 RepID=A0A5N6RQ03_9ROSI|nr:hypothetical protein FH972_018427 [Carpinus fangiana]
MINSQNLRNEIDRIKKENDNLQIELRELILLEEALENGYSSIRERQMDCWRMARKVNKDLEEEHKDLQFTLHQQEQEMAMKAASRDLEDDYVQRVRDYNSQMPLAFRVQPIQPNLQERI